MVQSSRFKVQGSRFKVQGSRFKVRGSRFKVQRSAGAVGTGVQGEISCVSDLNITDFSMVRRSIKPIKSLNLEP
jgi:hypothetical protein